MIVQSEVTIITHMRSVLPLGIEDSMELGVVKSFKNTPSNQYGFILLENGDEVFFHPSFGGTFIDDGVSEDPVFRPGLPSNYPMPQAGDEVLVAYKQGPKGLRASQWAYKTSFENADVLCQTRPVYRLYKRVGFEKRGKLFSGDPIRYLILWEGSNINELREKCPKTDPRFRIHNEPQSSLTIQYLEGDEWIDCSDPR